MNSSRVYELVIAVGAPRYVVNTTSLFVYCALADGDSYVHELISEMSKCGSNPVLYQPGQIMKFLGWIFVGLQFYVKSVEDSCGGEC